MMGTGEMYLVEGEGPVCFPRKQDQVIHVLTPSSENHVLLKYNNPGRNVKDGIGVTT